jgi:hypothetical protein
VKFHTLAPMGMLVGAAVFMSGCASLPPPDLTAQSIYCYRSKVDRYKKGPCTSTPVPSLARDAEAKQFKPDPGYLTVYVVRHSWGDGSNIVQVVADGGSAIETLPDTMVRLRLKPGSHELAYEFEGQRTTAQVVGGAGEVRFVWLSGTAWAWRSRYSWGDDQQAAIRQRASRTRLIADVQGA